MFGLFCKKYLTKLKLIKYWLGPLSSSAKSNFNQSTPVNLNSHAKQNVYSNKKVNVVTPLYVKAEEFYNRVALIDTHGQYMYHDLLRLSNSLANRILVEFFNKEPAYATGRNVAFLCENDASYLVTLWAIWMNTACAVPLCKQHPELELEYFITNSQAILVVATKTLAEKVKMVVEKNKVKFLELDESEYRICAKEIENSEQALDSVKEKQWKEAESLRINRIYQLLSYNNFKHLAALIVYTSGTTGNPKGVVHTFGSLQAQIQAMITAWKWTKRDVVLHVLPLHHVHGIVNVLMTPLYCGATCVMLAEFNAKEVWSMLTNPLNVNLPRSINVFMGVPTIYAKLIENYEKRLNAGYGIKPAKDYIKSVCMSKIRLMVSGSAALPLPIMEKWEKITGHCLLERYGMTEVGMALTNPLKGNRIPGAVGTPFPNVEVRIAQPNVYVATGYDVIAQGNSRCTTVTPGHVKEIQGELLLRGPNMFKAYYNNSTATKAAFTSDGWFKTGDTVSFKDGVYRILGRTSVDIIKSGGYKLSALVIEQHLLSHRNIADVAVVGIPDLTWGQKVAAVIVLHDASSELTLAELRSWAKDKLAPYELPSVLKVIASMPKNVMGKVNKKQLLETVLAKEYKGDM